jgi:hypothetical protein
MRRLELLCQSFGRFGLVLTRHDQAAKRVGTPCSKFLSRLFQFGFRLGMFALLHQNRCHQIECTRTSTSFRQLIESMRGITGDTCTLGQSPASGPKLCDDGISVGLSQASHLILSLQIQTIELQNELQSQRQVKVFQGLCRGNFTF